MLSVKSSLLKRYRVHLRVRPACVAALASGTESPEMQTCGALAWLPRTIPTPGPHAYAQERPRPITRVSLPTICPEAEHGQLQTGLGPPLRPQSPAQVSKGLRGAGTPHSTARSAARRPQIRQSGPSDGMQMIARFCCSYLIPRHCIMK